MCTVTYLPLNNNNFILTSNRDENPKRITISPKKYNENGVDLYFPKDKIAGGTWIGVSEKNRLICLLNGGFKIHQRKDSYKISRGVIVKMLLTSDNVLTDIENFNFEDIEPFTIVLADWNNSLKTYELVWTGTEKFFKELEQKPHIWSSSTLYTDEMKKLRRKWFTNWLVKHPKFHPQEIIKFHQDETKGNTEISLKMKRDLVETVSTTCIVKSTEKTTMQYINYINANATTITTPVPKKTKNV